MEFIHNKLQPFLVKSSGGRGAEGCGQGAGGGGKRAGAGGQGAGADSIPHPSVSLRFLWQGG